MSIVHSKSWNEDYVNKKCMRCIFNTQYWNGYKDEVFARNVDMKESTIKVS